MSKSYDRSNIQKERKKLMRDVLDLYDYEANGYVYAKDAGKILKAMGRTLDYDDEKNFVETADPENKGIISKETFLAAVEAMFSLPKNMLSELSEAFNIFDTDHDGKITANQFKNIMLKYGGDVEEKDVDELFQIIDVDKDSKINFNEFLEAWKFQ